MEPEAREGQRIPLREIVPRVPVTAAVVGLCLFLFVLFLFWPAGFERGVMKPDEVWRGEWWRLFSAIFLHVGLMHVAFNALWFWQLGAAIEIRRGSLTLLGLTLLTGVAGSLAELATAGLDTPGSVGLSGAVYGLFFFGYFGPRREDAAFEILFSQTNLKIFVGWGIFCVVATWLDLFPVANWAHGAGALVGALCGLATARRGAAARVLWAVVGALAIGLSLAGLRPVWSDRYRVVRAEDAFRAGRWAEAVEGYGAVLARHPKAMWLRSNLAVALEGAGRHCEAVRVAHALPDTYIDSVHTGNELLLLRLREMPLPLACPGEVPVPGSSGLGWPP